MTNDYTNPIDPGFGDLGGMSEEGSKFAADLIEKGEYQGVLGAYTVQEMTGGPLSGTKALRVRVNLEMGNGRQRPLFFNVSGFDRRWDNGDPTREYKLLGQLAKATGNVGKATEAIVQAGQAMSLTYVVGKRTRKDGDEENTVVAIRRAR